MCDLERHGPNHRDTADQILNKLDNVMLNLPTLLIALFRSMKTSLGNTAERPRLTEPFEYLRDLLEVTPSSVRAWLSSLRLTSYR